MTPRTATSTSDALQATRAVAATRWRLAATLTACMVIVYFGFIALVAFRPALLGTLVSDGLSVGIVMGACVIVAAWVLTWTYISWANRVYDPALAALKGSSAATESHHGTEGSAVMTPQAPAAAATSFGTPDPVAIGFFAVFICVTLGITWWAARRTQTAEHFYAAGRSVTAGQNGFALAGDYMSAASFLGIAGLVSTSGFDGLIYSTGWLVGWPVVLFLIAEPLRNLGRYTFADVVAARLNPVPVRISAAYGTLATIAFYLIAQMVGAGSLIRLLFGIPYETAVMIVGVAMMGYVLFGGMLATTWVQIVKAVLLLGGAALLALLVLAKFGFDPRALFAAAAAQHGAGVLAPGKLVSNPLDAISLGLALMFGTAGLPHILMRLYTVPDAVAARKSVFIATGLIGLFYLMTFILGFGAMVLVGPDVIKSIDAGGNMAAPMLAELLGGRPFLGFIAAVAFATILAVVAGLALSGAAAISHDLWSSVIRKGHPKPGEELKVARLATIGLALVAIALGVAFKGQNVAFMVGLAFAIAASANFPALVLSVFWRRTSTAGAAASMVVGTTATLLLIALSPAVQIDLLHKSSALFPLKNPALVTIPLSFLTGILVSLLVPDANGDQRYTDLERRLLLGTD